MAVVMQQTGSTCTCSAGISQQLSCVALMYTDVLIEVLSVEIPSRNTADYQLNISMFSPYSWAPSNVYIRTNLGSLTQLGRNFM